MAKTLGNIGNELNILFRAGTTWGEYRLTILNKDKTPVDITGYIFAGRIKKTYSSDLLAVFNINIIDGPNGVVGLSIPSSVTQTLKPTNGSPYIWDMEYTDLNNYVEPLFYGTVEVIGNV